MTDTTTAPLKGSDLKDKELWWIMNGYHTNDIWKRYQWTEGLNVCDPLADPPKGSPNLAINYYGPDESPSSANPDRGLYCTTYDRLVDFRDEFYHFNANMIGRVYLDDDVDVWPLEHCWKMYRATLGPLRKLSDLTLAEHDLLVHDCVEELVGFPVTVPITEDQWLKILAVDGMLLVFTSSLLRTHDMCMTSVQQRGKAVKYAYPQADEVVRAAIKQNKKAFKYVFHKTPELRAAAGLKPYKKWSGREDNEKASKPVKSNDL